jgi:hypothetical protein
MKSLNEAFIKWNWKTFIGVVMEIKLMSKLKTSKM